MREGKKRRWLNEKVLKDAPEAEVSVFLINFKASVQNVIGL